MSDVSLRSRLVTPANALSILVTPAKAPPILVTPAKAPPIFVTPAKAPPILVTPAKAPLILATPAKAGVHHPSFAYKQWGPVMDPRLRGDDAAVKVRRGGGKNAVRFAGYAAIFDRVDRGGDVVRAGAFARSLAHVGKVPLLYGHDPLKRIGEIETLAEDARGLRVIARLHDWTPTARAVSALLQAGQLTGLSFGYRVRGMEAGETRAAARTLTDLDLLEVSLVPTPMQPKARVHRVG